MPPASPATSWLRRCSTTWGVHDAGGPGAAGEQWEVTAHALSPARGATVLLATRVAVSCAGEEGAALPSLTGVWDGAAWHEREAAEMAGLAVTGHPDLRPLLLGEGVGVAPLRKDALLVGRSVRPWPGRLEPGEDGGAPSSGRRRAGVPGVAPPGWAQ